MADSPLMEELDAITEGKSKLDLAEEIWRLRKQVEDARLSAALHENAAGQLAQMAVDSVSPGATVPEGEPPLPNYTPSAEVCIAPQACETHNRCARGLELDAANVGLAHEVERIRTALENLVTAGDALGNRDEMTAVDEDAAQQKWDEAQEAARQFTDAAVMARAQKSTHSHERRISLPEGVKLAFVVKTDGEFWYLHGEDVVPGLNLANPDLQSVLDSVIPAWQKLHEVSPQRVPAPPCARSATERSAIAAIEEHNRICLESCGKTSNDQQVRESRRCDVRRNCPECPRDWLIEWPSSTERGSKG